MCREMPKGATPFIVEEIWSPGPPADLPAEVTLKKLSKMQISKNRRCRITSYGCLAYVLEPTSWGEFALVEQPPLRFLGRHQWKIVGSTISAKSEGIEGALAQVPVPPAASPSRWEGFGAFQIYSADQGFPAIEAADSEIYIRVEFGGPYDGFVALPPPPHERIWYRTVLAGYWEPKGGKHGAA